MMKHCLSAEWLNAGPLERKDASGADDPLAAIAALSTTLEAKFGKLEGDIKSASDRFEAEVARLKRPGAAEIKTGDQALEVKAFDTFLRKGREGLTPDELKSLNVSDDTQGGFIAPNEFVAELLRNVVMFSPVRSVAKVMTTGAPQVLLPKRTGGMTANWVGEKQDRPETNVTFGQNRYPVAELAAYIDVSNTILEDSAFDINALLAFEFAEEFGFEEGKAFVSGTGVLQPTGFLNDAGLSYTPGGHASQITSDGLIDLYHAIKPAYRASAVWMMNSNTLSAVRKLKDSVTGSYLLQPAGFNGAPANTILGRPVVEAPDMPDIAGNAFPIVFGDFAQGYRIFDRVALSVLRDPYSQATNGMTRFHGRRRVAGGVGKAEAIRKLKISTT